MAFSSSWLTNVLLLIITLSLILYLYLKRNFNYWKKRGVFSLQPILLAGNALDLMTFKKPVGLWLKDLYDTTPDEPFFGIHVFDQPHLILKSPDIIKQILVKDFNYFSDRTMAAPKHSDLYSNFLFLQKNPAWKTMRSKLSPTFSTGKLKSMFPVVKTIGENFSSYLGKQSGSLDAKEAAAKFSIDAVVKVLFGINAHCLDNENAAFLNIAKDMFAFTTRNAFVQISYMFKHDLVNLFNLEFFEKHITDFFREAFWNSFNSRKDLETNNFTLVDILREVRKQDLTFDGDKMAGQAAQLFVAGFETTASTISYTLYELCLNIEVQDKLRTEVNNCIQKHKGLTYEAMSEMKYLDMCVSETLRKYPVLPFLDRLCNADYKIPGTDIVIEKGTPIYIPLFGLHYDGKHFPNPEKYIPERYLKNINAEKLIHMPFGYGPRVCIGERLGMINTKLGIIHVIKDFVVERNLKTPVPISFAAKTFILQSEVGLPMTFKPIAQSSA